MLNRILLAAFLVVLATSCSSPWQGGGLHERAVLTDAFGNVHYLFPDATSLVPRVPIPNKLRPCCAFGTQLGVSVGPMPVPGFQLANVIDLDSLGLHNYDNGLLSVGKSQTGNLIKTEKNGLVYACRGGFIDTAHLRDYADWMLFLSTWVARHVEEGAVVELAKEGGSRRIALEPVDADLLDAHGLRAVSVAFADWLAFRLSIWHEIATWYGWSAIELFPERGSAFSPEDLYSNILGVKIARSILEVGGASSEALFNQNMDRWIRASLNELGAVDAGTGHTVMVALDGQWWDSQVRLPAPELIRRRNFAIGGPDRALADRGFPRARQGGRAGHRRVRSAGRSGRICQLRHSWKRANLQLCAARDRSGREDRGLPVSAPHEPRDHAGRLPRDRRSDREGKRCGIRQRQRPTQLRNTRPSQRTAAFSARRPTQDSVLGFRLSGSSECGAFAS